MATRKSAPNLLRAVTAAVNGATNEELLEAHERISVALSQRCSAVVELLVDAEEQPSPGALRDGIIFVRRVEQIMPNYLSFPRDSDDPYTHLRSNARDISEELGDVLLEVSVDA